MNTENVNFLHDTLKYLGFGINTPLNYALDEQLSQEPEAFTLHTEVSFDGDTTIEATLFFNQGKGDYADRYYFNKYDAVLHYLDRSVDDRKMTVRIEKNRKGITFKQAFNLLQGRYVQRKVLDQNNETHEWWLHLEFKVRASNGNPYLRYYKGNFDVEKALEAYPIRELGSPEQKERICSSLRRGNLHLVTFQHANGSWQNNMIYVNPEKQLVCNIGEATSAHRQRNPNVPVTAFLEFDKTDDDEISETVEEPARPRKKVLL
ncbi:MAG TPA: hypothetical protein VG605_04990 [Puia sp.]|nr:hypothetical protein [Puia sp.]